MELNPKGMQMSLSDPVLTGPHAGRTVDYGHGSSAELKIAGEQSGGEWAVVEWRIRAGDEPPIHTHTREDETVYVLDGASLRIACTDTDTKAASSRCALPCQWRAEPSVARTGCCRCIVPTVRRRDAADHLPGLQGPAPRRCSA